MPARNDFGVTVPAVALNITKTYHGLTIISETGQIVGRVQTYTPKFAERDVTLVYELNAYTWGRPIDNVPGVEKGRTLSVHRIEVWDEEMELAFGGAEDNSRNGGVEWIDLCEQTQPFIFQEAIFRGNSRYRSWEYLGCWFTSKDIDAYNATGDAKIIATSNMSYVIRRSL
jgi:hypothetical protein